MAVFIRLFVFYSETHFLFALGLQYNVLNPIVKACMKEYVEKRGLKSITVSGWADFLKYIMHPSLLIDYLNEHCK